MQPDTLSIILRSASFIALFQATGMAMFMAMFGRLLEVSLGSMRWIAASSAIAAILLVAGQYALEAARMADDMSGMLDPSLQMLAMHSNSSVVMVLRILGLSVIIAAVGRADVGTTWSVLGAAVVLVSFILIGHTAANPLRWALASLLLLHVTIVAFWFGALLPLYLASQRETRATAARVVDMFSRTAGWLVPGIFLAGLSLGLILVPHLHDLRLPYGILLLNKAGGFALLMGLAALNKWRLGPAIALDDVSAMRSFRRSLLAEYVLIAAVLTVTAVMTTLYSPQ